LAKSIESVCRLGLRNPLACLPVGRVYSQRVMGKDLRIISKKIAKIIKDSRGFSIVECRMWNAE